MKQKGVHRHQVQPETQTLSQNDAANHLVITTEDGSIPAQGHLPSVFILEAKIAPNKWQNIQVIYPRFDLPSCYLNKNEALSTKAALKSLLLGRWRNIFPKYPIRVKRIDLFLSDHKQMEIL
ncbi:hypothetical protein [Desulfocicer niacini]